VERLFGYLASALPGIQPFGSSLMVVLTASPGCIFFFLSACSSLKSTKIKEQNHHHWQYQALI
jgi:hypothetical protein